MTSDFIDPGIRSEVVLHLFRNYGPMAHRHALILALAGPTGEGKTYQTDRILLELGLDVARIESGELESELAGQPAERIRLTYLRAGVKDRANSVVVINDLDAAVGNWGDQVQYTVNRQAVFGQLMALCDSPTLVNGQSCERVPIVVTGNDFTKLYAPLTRAGRMRTVKWQPSVTRRLPIVERLLPWLSSADLGDLMYRFPDQPVAFWAAVASALDDEATLGVIAELGELRALEMARAGRIPRVDYSRMTPRHVVEVAERLADSSAHIDYLAPRATGDLYGKDGDVYSDEDLCSSSPPEDSSEGDASEGRGDL